MKVLVAFLCLFLSPLGHAHPVIYKDGWVYDGTFTPQMNIQRLAYTFHPRWAIESNTNAFKNMESYRDYALGVNFLLKRWLLNDSQGNIYLGLHAGYFDTDQAEGLVSHYSLMGDWESRRLYTAGKLKVFGFDDEHEFKYSYRFGIAPYVAGMNTLQTWLVLQMDYFEANQRRLFVTPLLRFFYNNVLWEIGANTQSQYYLNLMVHY